MNISSENTPETYEVPHTANTHTFPSLNHNTHCAKVALLFQFLFVRFLLFRFLHLLLLLPFGIGVWLCAKEMAKSVSDIRTF